MVKPANNKIKIILFVIVSITGIIYYYFFQKSLYPVVSINISDQYMFIEDFFGNDGVYGGSNLIVKLDKDGNSKVPFSKTYTRASDLSITRDGNWIYFLDDSPAMSDRLIANKLYTLNTKIAGNDNPSDSLDILLRKKFPKCYISGFTGLFFDNNMDNLFSVCGKTKSFHWHKISTGEILSYDDSLFYTKNISRVGTTPYFAIDHYISKTFNNGNRSIITVINTETSESFRIVDTVSIGIDISYNQDSILFYSKSIGNRLFINMVNVITHDINSFSVFSDSLTYFGETFVIGNEFHFVNQLVSHDRTLQTLFSYDMEEKSYKKIYRSDIDYLCLIPIILNRSRFKL